MYENPAPHFTLKVQPVDGGLLTMVKIYDGGGAVIDEFTKVVVDNDELRAEIAKLFV